MNEDWCFPASKRIKLLLFNILLNLLYYITFIHYYIKIIMYKINIKCWRIFIGWYFLSSYKEDSKKDKQTLLFNILINLLQYITFILHIKIKQLKLCAIYTYYIILYYIIVHRIKSYKFGITWVNDDRIFIHFWVN